MRRAPEEKGMCLLIPRAWGFAADRFCSFCRTFSVLLLGRRSRVACLAFRVNNSCMRFCFFTSSFSASFCCLAWFCTFYFSFHLWFGGWCIPHLWLCWVLDFGVLQCYHWWKVGACICFVLLMLFPGVYRCKS